MHWLIINIATLLTLNTLTINKLQDTSSCTPLDKNQYITSYDEKSFFESNLSEQVIDVENIDEELLNATLFFEFNKIRNHGRRAPLNPNDKLIQTCKNIVKKYSGNSFVRFNKKGKQEKRFKKILKKRAKEAGFNGTFIGGKVDYLPLIKIKKKKKYIYNEKNDNSDHLFFYKKKENRNGKKEYRPIESHTYKSFVKSIFKFQSKSQIKAKHFSEIGCYIQIYQKSKKKIPYAKIIWIVGGFRLGLL